MAPLVVTPRSEMAGARGLQWQELGAAGEALVLLHGNAPPDSLAPLAERLAAHFRVLLVHRPGFGASSALRAAGPEDGCDQIVAGLEAAGYWRFHLVGHSYGAYLGLRLAARGPDRVPRLTLLSPLQCVPPEDVPMMRQGAEALRAGADLTDGLVERWVAPGYLRRHPELTETVRRWLGDETGALADDIEETATVPDIRPWLTSVRAPTLVRVGELDLATPPDMAASIAAGLPDAVLERVPGVGHLLAIEDPEGTANSILARYGGGPVSSH